MRRPADWPDHMLAKELASGAVAYYWNLPTWARKRGDCPLANAALGQDYGRAKDQAKRYNELLAAYRTGEEIDPDKASYITGSVGWLRDEYEDHPKFKKLKKKTRADYSDAFNMIVERIIPNTKTKWGHVQLTEIQPGHADALAEVLAERPDGKNRYTQAKLCIAVIRVAWNRVYRKWPEIVPKNNPFMGTETKNTGEDVRPATLPELMKFCETANRTGHPSMALAAMVAYFWLQRKPDILENLPWSGYEPGSRVRVRHQKRDEWVWLPLTDTDSETGEAFSLFPELETQIAKTPVRGSLMVMRDEKDQSNQYRKEPEKAPFLPYTESYFDHLAVEIRRAAKLPEDCTFQCYRKGGLTEAGDAGGTDAEIMSTSGHKTREVLSIYVKRTNKQAGRLASKRLLLRQEQAGKK